jgi:hypothetical protein
MRRSRRVTSAKCSGVTEGYVPMRLPFSTTNYNDVFAAKGIPLEAAKGGDQTMFAEYQDYLKTLPPKPPYAQASRRHSSPAPSPACGLATTLPKSVRRQLRYRAT